MSRDSAIASALWLVCAVGVVLWVLAGCGGPVSPMPVQNTEGSDVCIDGYVMERLHENVWAFKDAGAGKGPKTCAPTVSLTEVTGVNCDTSGNCTASNGSCFKRMPDGTITDAGGSCQESARTSELSLPVTGSGSIMLSFFCDNSGYCTTEKHGCFQKRADGICPSLPFCPAYPTECKK